MPHEGYADPITNDGPRFHLDMPVGELAERNTQAIEASVVSSTPLVAETKDMVTHETRPTPIRPKGLRGSSRPILDRETEVQRPAHEGPEAASCRTRARGENIDEPQRPSPNLHRGK